MPEPKKNLSGLTISREVVRKELKESTEEVLKPSFTWSLLDSTDPSIVLDLIAEIQRRKALD